MASKAWNTFCHGDPMFVVQKAKMYQEDHHILQG